MNQQRPRLFTCLAAAGSVLGATAFSSCTPNDAPPVVVQMPAELAQRLERLEARLDGLEQRPAPASATATEVGAEVEHERTPAVAVDTAALEARLARLEEQVQALSRAGQRSETPSPMRIPDPATAVSEAQRAEQSRDVIVDPVSNEQQKLAAWRQLRHVEGSWNDAVVAQMVHIGLTSKDAAVRADVWRQADARSRHDALVPALLQAVQQDAEAKVRAEAAETLAEYADRPDVAAVVGQMVAIEQDPQVLRYLEAAAAAATRPKNSGR